MACQPCTCDLEAALQRVVGTALEPVLDQLEHLEAAVLAVPSKLDQRLTLREDATRAAPALLGTKDVARTLGKSAGWVRARAGLLGGFKLGGAQSDRWQFPREQVERFASTLSQRQASQPKAPTPDYAKRGAAARKGGAVGSARDAARRCGRAGRPTKKE